MSDRPYPALVKPDAVVLLPPEELEEQPRGVWPDPPRRSRWRSAVAVGVILAIGIGLGAILAPRAHQARQVEPQMLDGIAGAVTAPADGQEPGTDAGADVGAMESAGVPPAAEAPPAPSRPAASSADVPSTESTGAEPPPARAAVASFTDVRSAGSTGVEPPPARTVALFTDVRSAGSTGVEPPPARTVASFDDVRSGGTSATAPLPVPETVPDAGDDLAAATPDLIEEEAPPSDVPPEEIARQRAEVAANVTELARPPAIQAAPPAAVPRSGTDAGAQREPDPVARTVVSPLEAGSPPQPSLVPERTTPDRSATAEQARTVLTQGAMRFAGALGQVRTTGSAALNRQMAAIDAPARDLIRFAERARPNVGTTRLGSVNVEEGRAYADATLTLEWRGEFGVTRRGDIRVRLAAREQDGEWVLAGAQPLDGGPR